MLCIHFQSLFFFLGERLGCYVHVFNPCSSFSLFSLNSRRRRTEQYATRGVMVSTSAFLACHQCKSAGSSLAWGLNFRTLVYGIF